MNPDTEADDHWQADPRFSDLVFRSTGYVIAARQLAVDTRDRSPFGVIGRQQTASFWRNAGTVEHELATALFKASLTNHGLQSLAYAVQYAVFAGDVSRSTEWSKEAQSRMTGQRGLPRSTLRDLTQVRRDASKLRTAWTKSQKVIRAHFRASRDMADFPVDRAIDAAQQFPATGIGAFLLCRIMQEHKQYDTALQIYESAKPFIQSLPGFASIEANLLIQLKKADDAAEVAGRALRATPADPVLAIMYCTALLNSKSESTEEKAREVVRVTSGFLTMPERGRRFAGLMYLRYSALRRLGDHNQVAGARETLLEVSHHLAPELAGLVVQDAQADSLAGDLSLLASAAIRDAPLRLAA